MSMLRARRGRKWRSSLARALRVPRSPLPYRPYRLPTERLEPLDRRVTERDREWLKLLVDGPSKPPALPPILPPTGFDRSSSGDGGSANEPLPFHPRWVVTVLAVWAGIWFTLYVVSAYLFR
jgi:hypothetical protein